MSCSEIQLEISVGVDSGQPFEPPVERHLKGCAACREFLSDHQEWNLLFEQASEADPSPPAYLWTKIENEIRRREAEVPAAVGSGRSGLAGWLHDFARIPVRIPGWSAALAALVLVATLGVGVTQFQNDDGLEGLDQMIAQYRPSTVENPWLEVEWTENPFLDAYEKGSPNPFAGGD